MVEPVLLRIEEASKLLKVSKWTVYRWIEEGRLSATKIGLGSLRVFRTSVDGLIERARLDGPKTEIVSRSKVTPVRTKGAKRKRS
jgi:excisionase family DNA binding protein